MEDKEYNPHYDEVLYEKFFEMGKEFKVPVATAWLDIEQILNGETDKVYSDRSHSWNRNTYNWMMLVLGGMALSTSSFGAGYISIKATNETVTARGYYPCVKGIGNVGTWYLGDAGQLQGIVVGNGIAAESFDAHQLSSIIAHGTASGNLSYNRMNPASVTWNSDNLTFKSTIERYLNNNSGHTVNITEVGIYTYWADSVYVTSNYIISMCCRDIINPLIEVVDTAQLKLTYTITLTYPE